MNAAEVEVSSLSEKQRTALKAVFFFVFFGLLWQEFNLTRITAHHGGLKAPSQSHSVNNFPIWLPTIESFHFICNKEFVFFFFELPSEQSRLRGHNSANVLCGISPRIDIARVLHMFYVLFCFPQMSQICKNITFVESGYIKSANTLVSSSIDLIRFWGVNLFLAAVRRQIGRQTCFLLLSNLWVNASWFFLYLLINLFIFRENWRLSTVIWLLFTIRTNSTVPSLSLLFERGPCVQLSACTEAPINLQHVHSVLPETRMCTSGWGMEGGRERRGTKRRHSSVIRLKRCVWKESCPLRMPR